MTDLELANMAKTNDVTREVEWLVDSAATSHMLREGAHLEEYTKFSVPRGTLVGDNKVIEAIGTRRAKVQLKDGRTVKIKGLLHMPKIVRNLLSVPALTKLGYEVSFRERGCEISEGGKVLVEGEKNERLFKFKGRVEQPEEALPAVAATTKDCL